jgi:hypothetical protein
MKLYLISVQKLIVEMDALYVKGMINNPDMHLNAAMNWWIAAIQLFEFDLKHVPGKDFKGPDGLSRRRGTEDEGDEEEGEADEWVEEILSCSIWVASAWQDDAGTSGVLEHKGNDDIVSLAVSVEDSETGIPHSEEAAHRDNDLGSIKTYLSTLIAPRNLSEKQLKQFIKRASRFFMHGDQLWRREHSGRHQVVIIPSSERLSLMANPRWPWTQGFLLYLTNYHGLILVA